LNYFDILPNFSEQYFMIPYRDGVFGDKENGRENKEKIKRR